MKNVKTTFLALIGLAVGVLFAPGLGLYTWMATATPLHPNVQDVPSVSHAAPLREWAGAVEQARQLARTSLVKQNLPGLSVAVGAGGDIVWAEGFGWADLEKRVPVAPAVPETVQHAAVRQWRQTLCGHRRAGRVTAEFLQLSARSSSKGNPQTRSCRLASSPNRR